MAKKITLKNPQTGLVKQAYTGFSWTTLFFGVFPMLFRGEWLLFVIGAAISVLTAGVGSILWCVVGGFIYNRWHARRLVAKGYSQVIYAEGVPVDVAEAMLKGAVA